MFGKLGKKNLEKLSHMVNLDQKKDFSVLLEESPDQSITSIKSSLENLSKVNNSKTNTISDLNIKSPSTSKMDSQQLKINSETKQDQSLQTEYLNPGTSIKGDLSQRLLLEIEKLPDKTIKPVIDFNDNCLFYPILLKIGKSSDDISYLDELTTDGTLLKETLEKLIICPIHRDVFSSSVKLYCPKCNSLNVEKLNLFEHKRCGFITENLEYDFSDPNNSTCPSCKRTIKDFKKEIRIPAMWHQCLDCHDKFDNAIIKMYCRQHEHDFDINSGQFVTTYSYKIKDYDAPLSAEDNKMREVLVKLLDEFNFSSESKSLVKGKSGNNHKVPIFSKNRSNNETIAIFINNSETVSQSDINSILVPILDIGPKHTVLLSFSEIDQGVKPIAKQYGIQIIANSDVSQIIGDFDKFISENYSRHGEK